MPEAARTTTQRPRSPSCRDKYETKAKRLRDQIDGLEDKIDVLEEQSKSTRNSELLSTAGSMLGGLLGRQQVEGRDARRTARHGRYGRSTEGADQRRG